MSFRVVSLRKPKALTYSTFFYNTIVTNTYKKPFGRILFVFCVGVIQQRSPNYHTWDLLQQVLYNHWKKGNTEKTKECYFHDFMDGKTGNKKLWILLGHARNTLQSLEILWHVLNYSAVAQTNSLWLFVTRMAMLISSWIHVIVFPKIFKRKLRQRTHIKARTEASKEAARNYGPLS